MNNQQLIANQLLNSCIQIEEVRINRKLSIPRQITFQFNLNILDQLEQIKQSNHKLALKKSTLANLRYYALLASSSITNSSEIFSCKSPLTFACIYPINNNHKQIVIRSIINFEGQITQQIQADLWHNSQLLPKLIDLHNWLTSEIISQLPLTKKHRFMQLLSILWICFSIVVSIFLWLYFPINLLLKISLISLTIFILFKYCKKPLKSHLKSQVLSYLLDSSWPNTTRKRQIAWNTLHALS